MESRLAAGLKKAIEMQRQHEARADNLPAVVADRVGMLSYLSGWVSEEDPEASKLLDEMVAMLRNRPAPDPAEPINPLDDFNYVGSRHHY